MIASLPMYWRDETAEMWRAFWHHVQDAAPELDLPDLTAPGGIAQPWTDHWLRDDLALSMTCGLPFRTVLKDRVTYVGTLGFDVAAPAGHYHSQVIEAPNAMSGRALRLAYNSADSQSGWAVTQDAPPFAEPPRFSGLIETGSHAASLAAVAEGRADIAYIDAVTWRLLDRLDPNAARVRVVGASARTPGLPLITAPSNDPAPLRRAIHAATRRFAPDDPMAMGGPLSFYILDPQTYFDVPVPKPPIA